MKFEYEIDNIFETKELSTRYIESVNRYKCDFDRNNKMNTKRALQYPLIYLGLKRLIPLSTESENKIQKISLNLTQEEMSLFNSMAKEILLLVDDNINPEAIKSPNKNILAMKTSKYNHLGNSAGQDNVGQIISSILSFKRLKGKLGTDYKGGILLIDEIDATLYAGSQLKLLQVLNKYANALNIQIIFSTHSIEILEFLSNEINTPNSFVGKGCKINFLKSIEGIITNEVNPSIDWIKLKIKALRGKNQKIEKIDLICEDNTAELWIKNLINGTDSKIYFSPCGANLPKGTLCEMAKSPNKTLSNHKYILDGDARNDNNIHNTKNNISFLPGNHGAEVIMYHYVKALPETDEFWNEELNHTKQICFMDYQNFSNQNNAKNWFNDLNNKRDFFGKGYSKLFNRWKKDNKNAVEIFIQELNNINP